jgi:hypothetical protein
LSWEWFSGVFCGEIQWIALARCPVTSPFLNFIATNFARTSPLFVLLFQQAISTVAVPAGESCRKFFRRGLRYGLPCWASTADSTSAGTKRPQRCPPKASHRTGLRNLQDYGAASFGTCLLPSRRRPENVIVERSHRATRPVLQARPSNTSTLDVPASPQIGE